MLNLRRILALAMVLCLACGVSFAFTTFVEVPANTEPYSTDRPPWQPPPAPQGDISFFTTDSAFKDACGVTKTEDFSCTTAEPGGVCSGASPLNSTTNDGCFNECLSPKWEFNAIGIGQYAAIGTGFLGQGTPAVGANYFTDEANWSFVPETNCVGMVLYGDLIGPVTVDCTFQPSGAVIQVTGSSAGVFFGGVSTGAKISSVDCVEQIDGSADLYAALQFGNNNDGDDDDDVPASSSWGMIALLGLLMVGSLFFMRRRAEA
jgi:MYXO-CTERM domain-containing protein